MNPDKQLESIIAELTTKGATHIIPAYLGGEFLIPETQTLVYVDYILDGKIHTMHVNSLL